MPRGDETYDLTLSGADAQALLRALTPFAEDKGGRRLRFPGTRVIGMLGERSILLSLPYDSPAEEVARFATALGRVTTDNVLQLTDPTGNAVLPSELVARFERERDAPHGSRPDFGPVAPQEAALVAAPRRSLLANPVFLLLVLLIAVAFVLPAGCGLSCAAIGDCVGSHVHT